MLVLAREVELELVSGHYLVASGGCLADCRQWVVVAVAEVEVLEGDAEHGAHGVVVAVGGSEGQEAVVGGPHGDFGGEEVEVGLHQRRRFQYK